MRFSTRAIHEGQEPDPTTGATIPPVYFSSTYTQAAPGVNKGFEYSRTKNPTRDGLERALAALEGGAAAAAFASGLAAMSTLLLTLTPGDGIVFSHDLYGGTFRLFDKVMRPWGVDSVAAEGPDPAQWEAAAKRLKRPRMFWVETPTNPLLHVLDIEALARLCRRDGLLLAVDNTFATPYLQQPLALGADFSIHSTTKYLGGHSDVIGGAVVARTAELLEPVRFRQNAVGAVPGPLDCYFVQRGLKTLAVRMDRHCSNARRVAEWLSKHPRVNRVLYPGLADHPGHAVAKRQMSDFGAMVSVVIDGGATAVEKFLPRLKIFSLAESLGGVESLISHPATMTHAGIPAEIRRRRGIDDCLLRLSVGIEDVEDLLEDLEKALE